MGKHAAARHAGGRHIGPRWSAIVGVVGMGAASVAGGLVLGLLGPSFPGIDWSTPVNAGTITPSAPEIQGPIDAQPVIEPAAQEATGADPESPAGPFTPRTISILGVGDILVHREILQQAQADGNGTVDFLPQLDHQLIKIQSEV